MAAPPAQSAIDRWRSGLAEWAIPPEILAAAPESPWQFVTRPFAIRADRAMRATSPTPSRARALEALPEGGSVLDVGCGAGAASLPLLGRAARLYAVDTGADMLEELRARVPAGVDVTLINGAWPDVAGEVPMVDVAVCNHVAYNVADLDSAVLRMSEKARHRVVIELTRDHPRASQNYLWRMFHGIERPARPTADDAVAVIRECGLDAHAEEWTPDDLHMTAQDVDEMVPAVRRHLCLGPERDPEIARALESRLVRRDGLVGLAPTPVVTVWWDTGGG